MAEMTTRRADVVWQGNLAQGRGTFSTGSGALREQAVSWPARIERPDGKTSPEELIAAAHASCYAMALSHTLTQAGHAPERLEVSCEVAIEDVPGGIKVSRSTLTVRGHVPGLEGDFEEWARKGEQGCPVSNALRGNVAISVTATLEG